MKGLEPLSYRDGDVELTGHIARPAGAPRAAILVWPTIANITPAVADKAAALAEAGYLAFVADFYGRTAKAPGEWREFAMELRTDPTDYRRRLKAGLRALVSLPETERLPLATIGFCMGGQAALEMARDGAPLDCVVSFHGLLGAEMPAEPGAITAQLLVCHGDADPMVPRQQVLKFWEEMDRAGANWHFHSYSGVKHGFTNPYPVPPGNNAVAYDESADRQSWATMHAMFDELFGS